MVVLHLVTEDVNVDLKMVLQHLKLSFNIFWILSYTAYTDDGLEF